MQGSRHNTGKLKWSYVFWPAIEPMVRVLMFGAQKYTKQEVKLLTEVEKVLNRKIWESRQNVQNAKNTRISLQEGCAVNVTQMIQAGRLSAETVEKLEQLQELKDFVNLAMKKTDSQEEQKSLQEEQRTKKLIEVLKSSRQEREVDKRKGLLHQSIKPNKESGVNKDFLPNTEFQNNSTKSYYNVVVGCVDPKKDPTLTMTIQQDSLETCFVVSATKLLDCYKIILILLELYTNTSVTISEISDIESGVNNWKKGLPVTEIMESCLRHIFAFLEGEDRDPESGEHHLGHAMCNIMFALYMCMQRPDMDDRVIKQENKQLELWNKSV